jgi:hypothetical protein
MGIYKDKTYSFFPPGLPLLSSPLFLLGTTIGLAQAMSYLTVVLAATLSVYFLFLISHNVFKLSVATSVLVGLVFAFASPSWSYAVTFYQHHITTLIMLAGFYAAYLYYKEHRVRWLVIVSVLYSISWLFDYLNLIILFPLIGFLLWRTWTTLGTCQTKHVIFPATALVIATLSVMIYNTAVFGNWYVTSNNLIRYTADTAKTIVEETQRDPLLNTFRIQNIPRGLYILLFTPYRGLMWFSPLYILAAFGIKMWWKKKDSAGMLLLSLAVSTLLFYSLFRYPEGGWAFGPRFIIAVMAVLAPFIGYWYEKSLWRSKKIIFLILSVYSIAVALLGALTTNMIPAISRAYENYGDYSFYRLFTSLEINRSPSFIYNTLFSSIPLIYYYCLVLFVLIAAFSYIIYRSPHKQ